MIYVYDRRLYIFVIPEFACWIMKWMKTSEYLDIVPPSVFSVMCFWQDNEWMAGLNWAPRFLFLPDTWNKRKPEKMEEYKVMLQDMESGIL